MFSLSVNQTFLLISAFCAVMQDYIVDYFIFFFDERCVALKPFEEMWFVFSNYPSQV